MVTASSPIELEAMDGAVITDAVPLDIVAGDDQKMENGVLDDVDGEEEVAAEEEEDNVVDDDEHENEGKGATEGGGGDDASDSFEDVDESDEEERIAAEEGGDTVYFDDDEEEGEEEEEDYVLNTDNEELDDDDDDGEEEEEEGVDGEGHVFMDEDDQNEVENNNGLLEGYDASEYKEGGSIGKESVVEKEDEEKVDGNSEPKGRRLKKRVMKMVVRNIIEKSTDEAVVEEKGKTGNDGEKAPLEEENGKEVIEEKGKRVKKRLRLRNGDKQKDVSGSGEKVASEPTDKPDSKRKEKVRPKRVESMGMVFMCSSKTKQDCYQYKVLGLPAAKRNVVERIYKGMRLFLYDVDLKLMYGIYKAAAPGGYNLEPKAFNSKFPSQVRFTVLEDCIPLAEEKFRKVIKENYFSKKKFDCHLNHEQVKNLCKLFATSSKGPNSRRLDARPKAKVMRASTSMRRERPGPSRAVDGGRKRDRPRAPAADEGRHQKRTRRVDGGRPRALGANERRPRNGHSTVLPLEDNYRQRNYLQIHQREVVAPHPVVLHPPYAYERTLERDAYRPAVLVEHHRVPYREPLVVAHDPYKPLVPDYRDAYRQQPLPDYRGAYLQDSVLDRYDAYRRDRVSEHRDLQAVSVEARRYEPYSYYSYREREPNWNPVYGENRLPVEPDRFRSYNRTDYRSGGSPVADYRPTRGLHHRY